MPDLGLSGNGCDLANLLLLECVDYTALTDIGIANETNRDLLFVLVEKSELTKKIEQGGFSKTMLEGSMISECGISNYYY